ncbi:calcium-activated chloride channel regulator 1-like [Hypanus sabinus]|uniref:calcium-activated chloride channel regulator 1-like n=1 Tax=Hypanus sabinus TaxID=79690 RepID=UPI0028C478CF|nr:calcium-activated chloride channel regulator 1-like [Hypanus sabinus]
MTGGLQFAATDNLDTSGLIDSFTGLTSGNGDSSQQAIQLENLGRNIGNDTWLNGTVVIDEAIGNDTSFVITWETQTPYILLHDPSGKSHNNSDFKIDEIVHTARLQIYGTAQVPWNGALLEHQDQDCGKSTFYTGRCT